MLSTSDAVRTHAPLLAHAVQFVGNVRVRNRGTFGGTLSHADPTAEIAAITLAMGGEILLLGPAGERTVAVDDFFVTYLTTAVEPDEVVIGARLPVAGDARWGFHEVVRRYSDFATVSVSVLARPDRDWRGDRGCAWSSAVSPTGRSSSTTSCSNRRLATQVIPTVPARAPMRSRRHSTPTPTCTRPPTTDVDWSPSTPGACWMQVLSQEGGAA